MIVWFYLFDQIWWEITLKVKKINNVTRLRDNITFSNLKIWFFDSIEEIKVIKTNTCNNSIAFWLPAWMFCFSPQALIAEVIRIIMTSLYIPLFGLQRNNQFGRRSNSKKRRKNNSVFKDVVTETDAIERVKYCENTTRISEQMSEMIIFYILKWNKKIFTKVVINFASWKPLPIYIGQLHTLP